MLLYDEQLRMFEYRGAGFNCFFYSLAAAKKQLKEIYNITVETFLN